MTTLLIDGDPIAYQAAFSNQATGIDWGDGAGAEVTCDETAALADVDDLISKMQSDLGVTKIVVALSVATAAGWRFGILPTYKANRNGIAKPLALEACKRHLREKYEAMMRPTLEADDILGILATNNKIVRGDKIIVSIDKDLKQIPGRVYNPRREELVEVSRAEADYIHMMQTLMGDPVDGYTGIPGIGPKKAEKILTTGDDGIGNGPSYWERVVAAYESKDLTEADALAQARVARICRASDYDFKQRKVKLWNPPK